MNKKIYIVLSLYLLTSLVFSYDRDMSAFRIAYRETYRNYDFSYDYSESLRIGELGVNYTYAQIGGLYISTSVLLPGVYSKKVNDADSGLSIYDIRDYSKLSLGIDTLLGFGFYEKYGYYSDVMGALGLGLHLNGVSIYTGDSEYINKYDLGMGLAWDTAFPLGYYMYLNVGAMIAWDFLTLIDSPGNADAYDSIGTWSWTVFAGVDL